MFECLILGDSIATGVGPNLPECETRATVGITSEMFIAWDTGPKDAQIVVISLGSNDYVDPVKHLTALRKSINAERVIWIAPYSWGSTIDALAREYGDAVIPRRRVGGDGIHPDALGYRQMAEEVRELK